MGGDTRLILMDKITCDLKISQTLTHKKNNCQHGCSRLLYLSLLYCTLLCCAHISLLVLQCCCPLRQPTVGAFHWYVSETFQSVNVKNYLGAPERLWILRKRIRATCEKCIWVLSLKSEFWLYSPNSKIKYTDLQSSDCNSLFLTGE